MKMMVVLRITFTQKSCIFTQSASPKKLIYFQICNASLHVGCKYRNLLRLIDSVLWDPFKKFLVIPNQQDHGVPGLKQIPGTDVMSDDNTNDGMIRIM